MNNRTILILSKLFETIKKQVIKNKNTLTTVEKLQKFSNKHQELANTITHGLGILLSVVALTLLIIWASETQDMWKVISFSVFGTTLVLLYTASTLYHGAKTEKTKKFFEKIDHMAIYLLIAGSYTPFTLVTLRGMWGWSLFGAVWGVALLGIVYKLFFFGKMETFFYNSLCFYGLDGFDSDTTIL